MNGTTVAGVMGSLALLLGACTAPAAPAQSTAAPASEPKPTAPAAAPAPATATAAGAAASAQEPRGPGTYRIGASSPETSNLPVWLGIEQGTFQKYGVTVEYVNTGVGDTTVAALLSGEVAAALLGPSNLAGAVAAGSDLRAFSGIFPGLPYLLVTDPSINRIEDLKDKVVAIANPGGSGSVATEILLNQYGLKAGQNVTLVNYGSPPTRIQSVKAGQAAATLVTGATLSLMGDLKLFADLRDMDIPFQAAAITMSEKFAGSKPEAAEAIVKGAWDGTRILLDPARKPVVVASLKKNLNLEEAAAEDAYRETLKDFHAALPPRVSMEGVARIIEVLAHDDTRLVNIKAQDLVDNSIMDKLQKEGF